MQMEKPKLDIEKPAVAKAFDVLVIALFAAALVYLVLQWGQLPDRIPTHFGPDGEADRYGSRMELLLLPFIAAVMWAGMTALEKYPHMYNYLNLRPDTMEIQYRYGVLFMNVVKNLSVLLFIFLIWQTVDIGLMRTDSLNTPIFITILALLFGSMGYYVYRVMKL
ncbi:hypothetical protein SporoP37_10750 [Sporosarcina sp. P37]|uniref:DUF1648 domain-containing protein n=1 Tax=unclassified Sporosarcina TaxID=2647733 RepID=UPI0009BFA060|nr:MULTISPECIES: DUF1648 domain-containing protein [unclassified Sporosarcina]ARD48573.1 hypothetical protein SporoP33_10335 [Sporosarcina sp. P33]ARK25081.1 hypothetical protein SporoP37_10750 [Sporosarcina sp. P37]PID17929.1 DUF1648 domain-containing protein [Sporosarcina sp. P35]